MPFSRITHLLGALLIFLALAACSTTPPPSLSANETQQSLDAIRTQTMTVMNESSVTGMTGLFDGIDVAGALVVGDQLPRGVYDYDAATDTWTLTGPSDDLVLNWTVEATGEPATLTFDWNASAPTVVRDLTTGETVELPQGANSLLTVNGAVVADFDQTATWPENECGYLTEPGSFYVSGVMGDGATTLTLDETGVATTSSEGSLSVEAKGGAEVSAAAGRVWLDWTAGLGLSVVRDDVTCEIVDGDVESGHLSFDLGVDTDEHDASLGFATNFDIIPPADPSGDVTIGLSGGRLTLNGTLAVTWAGVLDDANHNGVPGDNVTLTFADGSMTLEDFLLEHYAAMVVGMRVAGALR